MGFTIIESMDSAYVKKAMSDAVREATLHVLTERREAGQPTHPFYWGAFVAAGDWH
jgi:CHAT domain-containing protein